MLGTVLIYILWDRSDPVILEYSVERRAKRRRKKQKPIPDRILALCKDPEVAAIDRDDQLWKFDPIASSLTCKKGPWHYELKTWSKFPAEGSFEVIQDSASKLLLTTQNDGTVILDANLEVDVQHWVRGHSTTTWTKFYPILQVCLEIKVP